MMEKRTLLNASNTLSEVNSVLEAIFMAATAIADRDQRDAIQFICNHAQTLLGEVSEVVDLARKGECI